MFFNRHLEFEFLVHGRRAWAREAGGDWEFLPDDDEMATLFEELMVQAEIDAMANTLYLVDEPVLIDNQPMYELQIDLNPALFANSMDAEIEEAILAADREGHFSAQATAWYAQEPTLPQKMNFLLSFPLEGVMTTITMDWDLSYNHTINIPPPPD